MFFVNKIHIYATNKFIFCLLVYNFHKNGCYLKYKTKTLLTKIFWYFVIQYKIVVNLVGKFLMNKTQVNYSYFHNHGIPGCFYVNKTLFVDSLKYHKKIRYNYSTLLYYSLLVQHFFIVHIQFFKYVIINVFFLC